MDSDNPRNYAVFSWRPRFNHRLTRGRFGAGDLRTTAVDAATKSNGVIIDLVSGRMIWQKGQWCDRQKPVGIRNLPAMETYATAKPS